MDEDQFTAKDRRRKTLFLPILIEVPNLRLGFLPTLKKMQAAKGQPFPIAMTPSAFALLMNEPEMIAGLGIAKKELDRIVAKAAAKTGRVRDASRPTPFDEVFDGPASACWRVEGALSGLLGLKWFYATIPEMRKQLTAMAGVLERDVTPANAAETSTELPTSWWSPPWLQIRAQFTGGEPFARGVGRDGDSSREGLWDRRYAPQRLKKLIEDGKFAEFNRRRIDVLPFVSALAEEIKGTRPPKVPELLFVEALACMWQSWGLGFTAIRRQTSVHEGPFPDFVRTALKSYPDIEVLQALLPGDDDAQRAIQVTEPSRYIREIADRFRPKT